MVQLAVQLVGRLLPEAATNINVRRLLEQCDKEGMQHCALMPTAHCLHTPGGPLKYSLEGHQFAVFGICLTSDARFVVSVSNKFLIWDLSTSDLTRMVTPGIEGVFKGLCLSPDDRFVAAWTNNSQTTILNLLTSELVVVNNPLISDDAVNGACLLDSHCILYGATEWVLVTMQGAVQQRHHAKMEAGFEMLTMDFRSLDEYHSTLWTGNLEDKRIIFQSHLGGHRTRPVHLNDALVVNRGRNVLFSCCDPSKPDVTLYRLKTGTYCFVSGLIVISVPWNSFVMFL